MCGGIVILGGYEQFIKSHLRKKYIDGVSNMQEHLVVTLDGKRLSCRTWYEFT